MKKLFYLSIFIFSFSVLSAQQKLSKEEKARREKNIQAGNPFVKYGCKAPVATLSKGKYLEVQDLDSIVTIGTMRWHVDNKQIVGHIVRDTLNPDAQPIGDAPGMWMSPDPLSEEFPSWSPYNMCMDNPLRLVDPNGKAPQDVIIGGTNKANAFTELQKSVNGQLNLTMDSAGKVSYSNIAGVTPNADATQLTSAINDHSITVKVNSTSNNSFVPFGDAFQGNTVTNSPTGNTVSANQSLNPTITERADSFYNKPGANTLHAVSEGYQGAKISQASGVSATPAINGIPNPVYDAAHAAATPQSGNIYADFVNSNGNVLPSDVGAVHISVYVTKPGDALEINSLPK